jgi:hypothetical protein
MQGDAMQESTNNTLRQKAYATPTLVRYGALTELTAAGTGQSSESAGIMNIMTCTPTNNFNQNCGM